MSTKAKNKVPAPGTSIVFLHPLTISVAGALTGRTMQRGQALCVTDKLVEANTDRYGNTWLSLLGDEQGQLQRWGRIMFVEGSELPEGEPLYLPGSFDQELEIDRLREA